MTGSFKERGARWALLNIPESERKAGVWAASAGNHALALCLYGKQLGIPVNVVMPRHAPLMKIDFCIKLGANVTVQGKDLSAAREIAFDMKDQHGGVYINGYDHIDILAGAGTIGLELLDQIKDLDAVLVPVGGGGCIAGIGCAIKSLKPNVKIIGIESETCPSFTVSFFVGGLVVGGILFLLLKLHLFNFSFAESSRSRNSRVYQGFTIIS